MCSGFYLKPNAELHSKGAAIMKDYTKYVGLDVSKDSISVAVADT